MLLTLKCDHATHLTSDSFERELTGVERWSLRLHHISCRYCRRLYGQLKLIHSAARRSTSSTKELSEEARQRIATILSAAESRKG
jgi:hypothetical protein